MATPLPGLLLHSGLRAKLASRNENKLRELARVLADWRLELLDASGYPPEEGATYYENALAKARHGAKFAGEAWVLGEDSGLEVEGLAGAPATSASWSHWRRPARSCAAPASSRAGSPSSRAATRASATTRSSFPLAKSEPSLSSATNGRPRTPTAPAPRGTCCGPSTSANAVLRAVSPGLAPGHAPGGRQAIPGAS